MDADHQPLIERRHGEVEFGEIFHHRETRRRHAVGDRAGAMIGQLREQQFAEDALKGLLGVTGAEYEVTGGDSAKDI